jgi:putative methionine-R-sulfoxide reductase with GAF domain
MRNPFLALRRLPLASQFVIVILLITSLSVIATTLLAIQRERQTFQDGLQQQAVILLDTVSGLLADSLYKLDTSAMNEALEGLGGEIILGGRVYDSQGRILADSANNAAALQLQPDALGLRLNEADGVIFEWKSDRLLAGKPILVGNQRLGAISLELSTTRLEARTAAVRNQGLIAALLMTVLAGALALWFSRSISQPLREMVSVSLRIAQGDYSSQAQVKGSHEVGVLAESFNSMTAKLRDLIGTLEQRVADRTRAIETSAEIGRRLSAVLSQDELVRAVVEQLQKELGYYHVHIYLFDREHENLVMAGGSGEAGQKLLASGHSLPKGKGLVGRAAHLNATVLISDVSRNPEWLPNPLLPETKSEAAVPIAIQDEVLGVIDVQQNTVNGLSQADADLIASIASQVAVALQNARLFTQAQRDAERKARLDAMGQEIQGAKSVEEALKISVRELGRALGAPRASVRLKSAALATGEIPAQPEKDV